MNSFETVLLLLSLIYSAFIIWCIAGWILIPEFIPHNSRPGFLLTVIIPARNEEDKIVACLESLYNQDFPKENFEVLVADDGSTDLTAQYVTQYIQANPGLNAVVLSLTDAPGETTLYKKRAITLAAKHARGKIILTTDADCILPPGWLKTYYDFYEKHQPALISAPVILADEKTFLEKIQSLEFLGLIGIGAATIRHHTPMMCNGANLAYEKQIFMDAGGYSNDPFASGDDTRLLLMIQKQGGKISFLKSRDVCVATKGKRSLHQLMQQRIRWSSKIPGQMNLFTLVVALCAWLLHFGLLLAIIPGFTHSASWAIPWLIKAGAEFIFLFILTGYFKKRKLILFFLPAQIIYPFYIVATGIMALRGSYVWKGRKI